MSEENTPHSILQLNEQGTVLLIEMLDIARKHGTREEARRALNFVTMIENNAAAIKKQLEDAESKTEEAKTVDVEGAV